MADDPKKKLPVLHGQVLPPSSQPGGVIRTAFSGFFAGLATRTQAANTAYFEELARTNRAKQDVIVSHTELLRSAERFLDLPNILQDDQDQRDHQRAVARDNRAHERHQLELRARRSQLDEIALTREISDAIHNGRRIDARYERDIMEDDILAQQQQLHNHNVLEALRIEKVRLETTRAQLERIQELMVRIDVHKQTKEEAELHKKALEAEWERFNALRDYEKALAANTTSDRDRVEDFNDDVLQAEIQTHDRRGNTDAADALRLYFAKIHNKPNA